MLDIVSGEWHNQLRCHILEILRVLVSAIVEGVREIECGIRVIGELIYKKHDEAQLLSLIIWPFERGGPNRAALRCLPCFQPCVNIDAIGQVAGYFIQLRGVKQPGKLLDVPLERLCVRPPQIRDRIFDLAQGRWQFFRRHGLSFLLCSSQRRTLDDLLSVMFLHP